MLVYMKAGGSSGTVFAWDLRWQQQPIVLSGVAAGEFQSHSLSESEIWEVQYDSYSSNIGNMSTSRVLPVMICSEDGILAVVEQGMKFVAISSFFHSSALVERLKVRNPLNSWLNHVLSTALTLTDRTPR
ncbi:hypothetical protein TEA_004630 [Camellia sinensis var. sinensis]|uniref:Uncharacterized protein n=1 Tax=Camellia sinensis var. sinensis TaxID=542762 RepID=A0A4S4E954_CAMSN|nr:hypothetical protein TEA_004630 [Camellia sinensis var. sinensis]